jgi:hypothetical protein
VADALGDAGVGGLANIDTVHVHEAAGVDDEISDRLAADALLRELVGILELRHRRNRLGGAIGLRIGDCAGTRGVSGGRRCRTNRGDRGSGRRPLRGVAGGAGLTLGARRNDQQCRRK